MKEIGAKPSFFPFKNQAIMGVNASPDSGPALPEPELVIRIPITMAYPASLKKGEAREVKPAAGADPFRVRERAKKFIPQGIRDDFICIQGCEAFSAALFFWAMCPFQGSR